MGRRKRQKHGNPENIEVKPLCPKCQGELDAENPHSICDVAGNWDIDADRWICQNGHIVFVGDAEVVQDAEAAMEDDLELDDSEIYEPLDEDESDDDMD